MIRTGYFLFISMMISLSLHSQVVITGEDMPAPGDTIRKSFTTFLDGIDYQLSGPDQTWLFEELTVVSQQVDTFMNVDETPSIYQLFFKNQWIYPDYNATVAQKLAQFAAIPGLTVTDTYLFIKNEDDEYREVGYGAAIEGVQLPIQLQEIDTLYRFPLEFGDIDSANSLLEVDIPDLGYLMQSKFRRNTVDGWGTLVTPYGEFQTLRVKTEITEYDSLYSDSLGFGMPVTRNVIEYKWLANGYHGPVLVVSEEPFLVTATYIDSVRSTFLAIPEVKTTKFEFSVYPNPARDNITVDYELNRDADVSISIHSIFGNELKRLTPGRQERGHYSQVICLEELHIPSGLYFIRLSADGVISSRKILVN